MSAAHKCTALDSDAAMVDVALAESVQQRMCMRCSALLVPGANCTMRLRSRRRKQKRTEVVVTCKGCKAIARLAGSGPRREDSSAAHLPANSAGGETMPSPSPATAQDSAVSPSPRKKQKRRRKSSSLFKLDTAGAATTRPDPSFLYNVGL